jgi:hypothetical protein
MNRLLRWVLALPGVMALSACLVTPGKFDSSLDIRADRSFSFAYKGEIIASDSGKGAMGLPEPASEDGKAEPAQLLLIAATKADSEADNDDDAQMRAIAEALTKEKGFRSVRYMGHRTFEIDYAISGRLTHAFLFPFNIDAQIVLPFVAVELRGDDRVRVKAPGFSSGFDKSQGPALGTGGPGEAATKALNGSFTLTTDAEIISQNQEEGAQSTPNGKRIVWRITPLTSEAPAATLRVKP